MCWVVGISCVAMVAVFAKLVYLPYALHSTASYSHIPQNLITIISLMVFWIVFCGVLYLVFKKIPLANKLLSWFIAINKSTFWKDQS
jgi:hypothetical protein